MTPRDPESAMKEVQAATEAVIEQGGTVHEEALMDATEAALDGQPKDFLMKIINGKTEGRYKPTSG